MARPRHLRLVHDDPPRRLGRLDRAVLLLCAIVSVALVALIVWAAWRLIR